MVPRSAKLEGFSRLLSFAIWQRKQIALLLFRQVMTHFETFPTCYREAVVSSVARDHVWLYIRNRTIFAVESKTSGQRTKVKSRTRQKATAAFGNGKWGVCVFGF